MLKKTILLVLVISAALAYHTEQEDPRLGNKVDDLLKKLRAIVDKAVAKAQQELDAAKAKIQQIADKLQASARNAMASTISSLKAQLDALKMKAKNAGVNIDSCLGADEQALLGLPDKYSGDMVHCVSDQITQAIKYAQDALDKIKKIVDDIENIKQEIKDCGHGLKSLKCFEKLAVKIEKEIVSLPTEIEVDVAASIAQITQLQPKVEKCASEKTDACENDAKSLFEKISLCIATKLIPHVVML